MPCSRGETSVLSESLQSASVALYIYPRQSLDWQPNNFIFITPPLILGNLLRFFIGFHQIFRFLLDLYLFFQFFYTPNGASC